MKTFLISVRLNIVMMVLTGLIYPFAMTAVSRALDLRKSEGSLIYNKQNVVVGSELIAQSFKNEKYFWPRPSAVDFNPMPSGGSNLGPTSQDLLNKFKERQKQGLTHEMLFASGSGLDPHISPEAAADQVARVASARFKSEDDITRLVGEFTEKRQFGFLGQERINVLKLNLALDERL